MNPNNHNQLNIDELDQVRYDLFQEVSSYNGPLSKDLQTRLNRLPRNIRKHLVETENNGCSSLFTACCRGNFEIAEYLITKCGANIEQRGILFDYAHRKDEEFEDYTVCCLCCAATVCCLWRRPSSAREVSCQTRM
ncbi:uncharacterized protein LOC129774567 [Toxorhynchites rutilus septentrionalis]|uniref:uncharacterized protein LOC129774567 n=1 Tax=Toxorhynchites rutilus septentrionalis TaxID=329112 RepID=UPI00247AA772|nr:uncharacterized protein LOC129774567 [Toxorhynchites rutilus septentrionalis]